jgi:arylsulfatase A-like enzyme
MNEDRTMRSRAIERRARPHLLALALLLIASHGAESQTRPNIVFIFSDDHAAHALSAYRPHLPYGVRLPDTPRLDGLAAQGMLFLNAFVVNSICAPSRATVLTGQYGHLNGVPTNREPFHPTNITFPGLLQDAGYATALFGKWHLKSQPMGFGHYEILAGQGPYYNPTLLDGRDSVRHTGYTQDIITDRALHWLDARAGDEEPFLLLLHYNAVHRFWDPGPDQLPLYRDMVFPEPPTFWDDGARRASPFRLQEMEIGRDLFARDLKLEEPAGLTADQLALWRSYYDPENERAAHLEGDALTRWKYQRYIGDYMRVVSALDTNVGRVLDHLDAAGLAGNTVVVYASDQGFFIGDRGWFDKRWMYEESLRMPLIVRWPGTVAAGAIDEHLVLNLDLAQTLLDVGGAAEPAAMQGRSLVPLLRGNAPGDWRDAIYYQYFEYPDWHMVHRQYGIRTHRYKLIHYYEIGEWELFDLHRDPHELASVHADPDYATVRADLERQLQQLREAFGVPAEDPVPHTPFEAPPGLRRPQPHH